MKIKRRIHKDKRGREFIKESYFVGGKQKFRRVYLIDGKPEEEFHSENKSPCDYFRTKGNWLIICEKENSDNGKHQSKQEADYPEGQKDELPF